MMMWKILEGNEEAVYSPKETEPQTAGDVVIISQGCVCGGQRRNGRETLFERMRWRLGRLESLQQELELPQLLQKTFKTRIHLFYRGI